TVNNLAIPFDRLKHIYMVTGVCSIVAGPLLGRFGDSVGKYVLFVAGTAVGTVMILIYTHLGPTPIWQVIVINSLLFVGITSGMLAAGAIMSAVPDPASRGAFMAVNSSIQQVAGGVAAAIAGLIVVETAGGKLARYDILGFVVIASMTVTVILLRRI